MFSVSTDYEREELLDFVGSRQNQSGIIWGKKDETCMIVTSGGRGGRSLGYSDRKNEDGSILYVGQGEKGDQDPTKFSNSLLANGNRSVLFFSTRDPNAEEVRRRGSYKKLYRFEGIYQVASWEFFVPKEGKRAGNKLMIFLLVPANNVFDIHDPVSGKENNLTNARTTLQELKTKLKNKGTKPTMGKISPREYISRSRDIVIYAKARANGICEYCSKAAPFVDERGNSFLEVHHIFRLADDGPDEPENVAAICPNCHREAHYGIKKQAIKEELIEIVAKKENSIVSHGH